MKSNIKWLIAKKDLKQNKIAKQIGVTPQQFNLWVKGTHYPRIDKAQKLADILGCTLDDLYEKDEDNEQTSTGRAPDNGDAPIS